MNSWLGQYQQSLMTAALKVTEGPLNVSPGFSFAITYSPHW